MRRAYLKATRAEIHCPHCHEAIGQDDTHAFSLREMLDLLDGKQTKILVCGACSRTFVLHAQTIRGVL